MPIACNHLTYKYPGTDVTVFDQLSCEFPDTGFHALFGHSGVGKTTLARIFSGDIQTGSEPLPLVWEKTVLYTHNMERIPGWAPVGEMIESVTPEESRKDMEELLAAFGLNPVLESRFDHLSLGQKNRANLARYLLQKFDVLIMDESLANVDETTREKIIGIMKTRFPEKCFLYISHNMMEVSRYSRQIIILRGTHRRPQVVSLRGMDDRHPERGPRTRDLEKIMLEIVHAS